MNKKIIAVLAAGLAGIYLTGCAELLAVSNALSTPVGKKGGGQKSLVAAHLAENKGKPVQCTDINEAKRKAKQALEAMGFRFDRVEQDNSGPGGQGMVILFEKHENVDLGNQVANNLIGNMLGADRGKIIKRKETFVRIGLRWKWADDGLAKDGNTLLVRAQGERHDINQNDQRVNQVPLNEDEKLAFIRAAKQTIKQ